MFKNIKQRVKAFITGKSGFSLVELIVVIAIMAVMAAVLAPALLGYVEKSRMQKDDSAMDEVVNAVQLSLADQSIYDEVLEHSVWDNVSCYIDKKDESQFASHKITLKAANGDKKEQYMFGDEARLLDETVYYAAGNMRGLTITWSPNESGDTYDFANGILNKFVGRKTGLLSENPELYNRLRSVIGDKLDTTSQTYRNSDYTIFIRVGSTGGSEAVMQDAIQVWGQFNGTNLAEKDHKFELSSGRVVGLAGQDDTNRNNINNGENSNEIDFSEKAPLNHGKVIPAGGSYYSKVENKTYEAGMLFPTLGVGDRYYFEDYMYQCYNNESDYYLGLYWQVNLKANKTAQQYGMILESINGLDVFSTGYTFNNCTNLKVAPKMPNKTYYAHSAFSGCISLESSPALPSTLKIADKIFENCTSLKVAPSMLNCTDVSNMDFIFANCTSLTTAPDMRNIKSVDLRGAFSGCTSLTSVTSLPINIRDFRKTFENCSNLSALTIPCAHYAAMAKWDGCTAIIAIGENCTHN